MGNSMVSDVEFPSNQSIDTMHSKNGTECIYDDNKNVCVMRMMMVMTIRMYKYIYRMEY